jgi:hypothetical protein
MEPGKEKVSIAATPAARWALAGGLALWTAIGFTPFGRPDPLPADAPAGEFSAGRAMVTVRAIAQRPHPVGSADHDRVRDYVLAEFARLGLTPQTQAGTGVFRRYTGKVENIVARLPGSASTRPVMLAAHYDSTRRGPGAGDDAHGVAVLLETLRVLGQSARLRNDVIFLVTDGEEAGMLGAALFMNGHPWRGEPGVVLNFEARGTGGAATMFETSQNNAWLVHALRTAVPAANATSFAYEVYRRMPNDTDLSVFKRDGLAGMNFAFIEHPEWYHRPQDDAAHLDLRSVQEQGRYALALTREFGARDLNQPPSGDAVYFPTRLTGLIVYSTAWVQPLVHCRGVTSGCGGRLAAPRARVLVGLGISGSGDSATPGSQGCSGCDVSAGMATGWSGDFVRRLDDRAAGDRRRLAAGSADAHPGVIAAVDRADAAHADCCPRSPRRGNRRCGGSALDADCGVPASQADGGVASQAVGRRERLMPHTF